MVAAGYGERRRDGRLLVKLNGFVEVDGEHCPVTVTDLSAFGALLQIDGKYRRGQPMTLHVEPFGPVEAQVAHSAAGYCGIEFRGPPDRIAQLSAWLDDRPAPSD